MSGWAATRREDIRDLAARSVHLRLSKRVCMCAGVRVRVCQLAKR